MPKWNFFSLMKRCLFVGGAVILLMFGLAAPGLAQTSGSKDIIITVYDVNSRPLPGVEVKVYPRKEVKIKGVILQAVTDENGRIDLTDAKGKAIPTSTIMQGAGLRFVASHPKWETETSEAWSDELLYTSEPKELDIYLRKPILPVNTYGFEKVEVESFWRGTDPTHRANEKELMRADPESGERVVFSISSAPPAELTNGAEFTVTAQASITSAEMDYVLQMCWVSRPDGTGLECTAGFTGSMPYVGLNFETKKVTPTASSEIKVKVPLQFEGEQPRLVFRIGTALDIEPTFTDWMSWVYKKK